MLKIKEFFILNFVFPLADKLMGTCAMKWYRQICKMNLWNREEINHWQNEHLQKFVKHAYEHTVYYKRVFDELGITPEDIKTAEDLKKLPIVNKEIVNSHFDEFVPDNIGKFRYRKSRTGGTTGEPMFYYCDENTWGYVTAAKIYYWTKTTYHYGDAFIALGSSSLFPEKKNRIRELYDKMRCEYGKNGMNMSNEICEEYADFVKQKRIEYVYGYASSVYLFAKYIVENNIDLSFVKAVFTTSEKLLPEYRNVIEKAFGCEVMDSYGARDAGITAYEIKQGLYPMGYNIIAETINEFGDGIGTLLTTNFFNYAFPLIRYEFGDEARIGYDDAYNGQVLFEIVGRTSDVIRLSNGHNVTGPGFTILMSTFNIVAYNIRQTGPKSIELRIQPDENLFTKEQENQIISKFKNYIGEDCVLNLVYVDHFEPLKNGKRRYFMN